MADLGDKPNAKHWAEAGAAALFVLFALKRLTNTTTDPDLFGYLAFGRLFWEASAFPYQDVFSYVPTLKPWVYHEWLTGVLFYPLHQALGAFGLKLLKYGLGLAALAFLGLTARERGAGFWAIVFSSSWSRVSWPAATVRCGLRSLPMPFFAQPLSPGNRPSDRSLGGAHLAHPPPVLLVQPARRLSGQPGVDLDVCRG